MLYDRYRGAMLGLAVGDALGTTLEFKAPGTFKPITDMLGGGPFRLKPGQWTDDTSMALCLAESLTEKRSFDPKDQMDRYCRWWREGYLSSTGTCFDIGVTVRTSLGSYLRCSVVGRCPTILLIGGMPYDGSVNSRAEPKR
jgi:ADP-ribosyl-[dinitrogen reductase] hydrolase